MALATGMGYLAIWSRIFIARIFGWMDFILVVAFLMTLSLVIQTTWAIVDEGQGKHMPDIPESYALIVARVCCDYPFRCGLLC